MSARRAALTVLRLYPRAWRKRYGDEVEALLECHDVGLRTLADLLLGAFDAWTDPAFRAGRRPSLSRTETLAGLLPFLCYGGTVVLFDLVRLGPSPQSPYVLYFMLSLYALAVLLMPLVGLGIGWARSFPTWAYPYAGIAVMLTVQEESQPVPYIGVLGVTLVSPARGAPDLLGWRAWLPLLAVVVILLLVTRSMHPLRRLVSGIWHDWTLLSFAMYGILPLLLWISFDEVAAGYRLAYMLAIFLILVIGALAYLRSGKTWKRALALGTAAGIAVALAIAGSTLYWHGVQWFTYAPPNGPASALMRLGAVLTLLLSPALLGALRFLLERVRRPSAPLATTG